MAKELDHRKVAFLVANEGVEQVELTEPWAAVERAGGTPELIAPEAGTVQAFHHLEAADTFPVDHTIADVVADDYVGIVLPGGVANPDQLRLERAAPRVQQRAQDRGIDERRAGEVDDDPVAASEGLVQALA